MKEALSTHLIELTYVGPSALWLCAYATACVPSHAFSPVSAVVPRLRVVDNNTTLLTHRDIRDARCYVSARLGYVYGTSDCRGTTWLPHSRAPLLESRGESLLD